LTVESLTITPLGAELLDDPAAEPAAVRESLRNIARANRWFGGAAAVKHGLARVLAGVPRGRTLSLLDVGTGAGDLSGVVVRWAARRGIRVRPVGLERSRVAAAMALDSGVPCAVACAGLPPIREKGVDLILLSQLVHHLAPASTIRLLQSCDRLARLGVIVADLRRGPTATLGFWCAARLLRFDPNTRRDGLTSIRRGYTAAELRALLAAAGVRGRVERRPGHRLVATWRPAGI